MQTVDFLSGQMSNQMVSIQLIYTVNMENSFSDVCPIARSLECAGDAWSIMILRDANLGLTRFDQFQKNLNIAPTMLTRRLATLTQEGLLKKQQYSQRPPRDEYVLTDAGRDFLPVLFMLGAWGRKHRGKKKLIKFVDAETGKEIRPVVIDSSNGTEVGTRPIRTIFPK